MDQTFCSHFQGRWVTFSPISREEIKTKSEVTVRLQVSLPGVYFVLLCLGAGSFLRESPVSQAAALSFIVLLRITLYSDPPPYTFCPDTPCSFLCLATYVTPSLLVLLPASPQVGVI